MNPHIFRRYDIRGLVGRDLTESLAKQIGQAVATQMRAQGRKKLVVGRDGRLSSPALSQALVEGVLSAGVTVIDLGEVTTPMVYFAAKTLEGANSCVVVTGSHNPPDYNGIKIVIDDVTLWGDAIQAIRKRIEQQAFELGRGEYRKLDIISSYRQAVVSRIRLMRPLKVVVDCGNGISGASAPDLIKALGCEVIELFCEVDGHFPNHHPDPAQPKNLQDLIQAVKAHDADIGLAFDGDGDRCGVVDDQGGILYADRQLMLLARDVLRKQPGANIVFDIKCSALLAKDIKRHGGRPIMWKTGHSLMKAKMQDSGAALGGELSGHIFFAHNWFGFDDGLYAAARLLQILAAQSKPSHVLFGELPDAYSTPELEVHCAEGQPQAFMQRFAEQAKFDDATLFTLDGVRADFVDGWGLIRASNTAPNLVVRFEGETPQALERIKDQFRKQILAVDPSLNLPF
jgi:phosphomannomutase/phosphomannomutase/phosphoglucomutase